MPSVATADTLSSTGVMLATGTVDMSKKSLEGLRVYWCNALSSTGTDTYCKLPVNCGFSAYGLNINYRQFHTLGAILRQQVYYVRLSALCD